MRENAVYAKLSAAPAGTCFNNFRVAMPLPTARVPRAAAAPQRLGLRVALFTGAYNHIADGVSLTLNRLVAYLTAQGFDVRVFAPTSDTPALEHAGTLVPVPSLPLPGRPEYRLSAGLTPRLRKEVLAFAPDVIHIATPDVVGFQALRLAKKHGIPVVSTYHTHFSSYLSYYGVGWLESALWRYARWFYEKCDEVYVPSQSMLDVLRAHGIRGNLGIWARGVDTERFNPERRSDAWRAEHGFGPDEVVVSFVGRLVWEKGLTVYADVIEGLEARGIPHRSLVVGDGPARADLEARLENTVFTGHLAGTDLAVAHASGDVFVFPSETETFGNVTLEAMASGVPTVCADATGSASLVTSGETGFLVPPRDSQAFFAATEALVLDADLRAQMGRAALEKARGFAWKKILRQMHEHYYALASPMSGDGVADVPVPSPAVGALEHA